MGSLPDRTSRPRLALPYTVVAGRDAVHLVAGEDHRYTLGGAGLETWLPGLLAGCDGRRSLEDLLAALDDSASDTQLAKLATLKKTRDNDRVKATLDTLRAAARGTHNLMPPILDAVRAYATVGELCDALRDVWGEYEEVPIV